MLQQKMQTIAQELKLLYQKLDQIPDEQHSIPHPEFAQQAEKISQNLENISSQIIDVLPETEDKIELSLDTLQNTEEYQELTAQQKSLAVLTNYSLASEHSIINQFKDFRVSLSELPVLLLSGCDRDLRPRLLCYVPLTQQLHYEAESFIKYL